MKIWIAIKTGIWAARNWESLSSMHYGMLRDQHYSYRKIDQHSAGRVAALAPYMFQFDTAPFAAANKAQLEKDTGVGGLTPELQAWIDGRKKRAEDKP